MKPRELDIPPEVARKFVRHMRAWHAEKNAVKRDAIAAETRHILLEHLPAGTRLRLTEVARMFRHMCDDLG